MKIRCSEFIKAILAGIAISVGGTVFLSCDNKYIGAFLFSVGLITVVCFGLNLYTGKIGYVLENDKVFLLDTALSVIGNFIGCLIVGLLRTPVGSVSDIVVLKLEKPLLSVFVDAVFCGLLIFICVDIFKKRNNFIGILFCIPTFILCGFEHSVADMFYIVNAHILTLSSVIFVAVVILGNAIGGLFIPVCNKIITTLQKEKNSD